MDRSLRERGRFVNPWPSGAADQGARFADFLRWRLAPDARRRRRENRRSAWTPPRAGATPPPAGDATSVTWVGHSTWLLRHRGVAVLTDPVLGDLPAGIRRRAPPAFGPGSIPRLDALLVSHNHYDHLERRTVERLPRDLPVRCGLGVGPWFRRLGFRDVAELDWGDAAPVLDLEATFVPAQHFSGRTATDRNRTLWGGFVLRPRGASRGGLYYAGDTGAFPGFRTLGTEFPGLDFAILPIGAYEPRWFMRVVHLDPEEAVAAFLDTGARTMACGHWGTFGLADEPWEDPPRRATAASAAAGVADRVFVPAVGETRTVAAPVPADPPP